MNSNSQILCKPTEIWTLSSPFECVLHRNTSLSLYLLLCTFPKILSRGQNCLNIPGLQTLIEDSYLSHDSEKNCTKYLFQQKWLSLSRLPFSCYSKWSLVKRTVRPHSCPPQVQTAQQTSPGSQSRTQTQSTARGNQGQRYFDDVSPQMSLLHVSFQFILCN